MRPKQTYRDVFQAALETTAHGTASPSKQVSEMRTKLVAHYWACVSFCWRWLGAPGSHPEPVHIHAVSRIIDCLPAAASPLLTATQRRQDKGSPIRFAWPMFMASIETRDPAQRDWLLARLRESRNASAECEWCWVAARDIVRLQTRLRSQAAMVSGLTHDDACCYWST